MGYEGPLPRPDKDSEIYWQAAHRHELVLQQCQACEKYRFYPRSVCPYCLSDQFDWKPVSGRGIVYSFTVIHRPPFPAFRDRVPYILGLIDLEEGVRMMSNLIGCDSNDVQIGAPVEVTFEDVTDEISLPQFRLIK